MMRPCFICGATDLCFHREPALLSEEERNRFYNSYSTDESGRTKHAIELQIIADRLFAGPVVRKPVEKAGKQHVNNPGRRQISTRR